MAGEGDQVRVAEAVADGGDPLEHLPRLLEVALAHGLHGVGEQHESLLRAVGPHVAEQPPHPPDPAAGLGGLAPLHPAQDQPEGGPRGALRLPAADEALVGAGQ